MSNWQLFLSDLVFLEIDTMYDMTLTRLAPEAW